MWRGVRNKSTSRRCVPASAMRENMGRPSKRTSVGGDDQIACGDQVPQAAPAKRRLGHLATTGLSISCMNRAKVPVQSPKSAPSPRGALRDRFPFAVERWSQNRRPAMKCVPFPLSREKQTTELSGLRFQTIVEESPHQCIRFRCCLGLGGAIKKKPYHSASGPSNSKESECFSEICALACSSLVAEDGSVALTTA